MSDSFKMIEADFHRWWPNRPFSISTFWIAVLSEPGFLAVVMLRVKMYLHASRRQKCARAVRALAINFTGADFGDGCVIGPGLVMRHPVGIVISGKTVVGSNLTILQNVTLGEKTIAGDAERSHPRVGDDVVISAGAKILGGIVIGDRATIGANAVVLNDVPSDSTAVGVPAVIKMKTSKNL